MSTIKETSKTAIITGASRGIGKAIAYLFAEKGYNLILTCKHSIIELKEYAIELSDTFGISCRGFQCDSFDSSAVHMLFEQIDSVDVLINNSGISYVGLLSEMTDEDWNEVIGTNLSSAFFFSREAIKLMLKKHSGKIINISSVWGNAGASMEVAYSASKGGLDAFTKALAKELAPSNIQVNAIACGLIDTDMNKCFSKDELDAVIEEIPASRIGKPMDVAQLAYDLSKGNSYLTGQIIKLDGGWI